MPEKCWCGKMIHYCDDGLVNGRVACECSIGQDHGLDVCKVCLGEEGDPHDDGAGS